MNPVLPRLYGLPKLHEESVPIRPVVSFINAPTYNLCGFIDSWFKSFTKFQPRYSVKNTVDLVDRIKDFNPFQFYFGLV